MRFKEWLINEQEGDDGDGEEGVTWDLLYPTKASDYVNAVKNPRSHYFLQWRWNRGEELGRPLYNIDNKEFQKRGYVSVKSTEMPSATQRWEHKDNEVTSSLEIIKQTRPNLLGVGKNSEDINVIKKPLYLHPFGVNPKYEPDSLNSIFHDKPTGKYPSYEKHGSEEPPSTPKNRYLGDFGQNVQREQTVGNLNVVGLGHKSNVDLGPEAGIKSKYHAVDKPIEDKKEKRKIAKFGFGKKKRLIRINNDKPNVPLRLPQVYD